MRFFPLVLLSLSFVACSESQPAALDGEASPAFKAGEVGTLDAAEETHLIFMREEEKLARDVYDTLGILYPTLNTFERIFDSEERHANTMADMLVTFSIDDPSTSDERGVYTGADYGWYFTEKFDLLVTWGEADSLEALYVGAFIEELDMHDIAHCPEVVDSTYALGEDGCGLAYTDEPALKASYNNLLSASGNHLRAYVKAIEQITGEDYVAQYLSQAEVDSILGG